MIKLGNVAQQVITLVAPGTVTAAANKDMAIVQFNGVLQNIYAACVSGGTGVTNSIADVNLNGTTIFGSATKITFASTTGTATYGTLTTDPTPVVAGDVISLDVDSVSTSPAGFIVDLVITRAQPAAVSTLSDLTQLY